MTFPVASEVGGASAPSTSACPEDHKVCSRCRVAVPFADYSAGRGKGGTFGYCKACQLAYAQERRAADLDAAKQRRRDAYVARREAEIARGKAYREANPEVVALTARRHLLKKKYGLTLEAFDAMVAAQKGRCAICREEPQGGKPLHIDHCHASGRVRSLLCSRCNTAIGLLRDDPEIALRASTYLRISKGVAA